MYIYIYLSLSPLISLSFFNSHPSNRVSFSFHLRASDRVHSEKPARASMVVHGPAFLYRFQIPFLRFDLYAMAKIQLAAGFDLASFRIYSTNKPIKPPWLDG